MVTDAVGRRPAEHIYVSPASDNDALRYRRPRPTRRWERSMETTDREKTLEMRVAELEDKLKGLQVTEEEMRAFNKVASLMGLVPQAAAMPAAEATAAAGMAAGGGVS